MRGPRWMFLLTIAATVVATPLAQGGGATRQSGQQAAPAKPTKDDPRVERLKTEAIADVDSMRQFTQQMVDSIFSFASWAFRSWRHIAIRWTS